MAYTVTEWQTVPEISAQGLRIIGGVPHDSYTISVCYSRAAPEANQPVRFFDRAFRIESVFTMHNTRSDPKFFLQRYAHTNCEG